MEEWKEKLHNCVICNKELTGRQTKFCSKSCKSKDYNSDPERRRYYQDRQNERRRGNKIIFLEQFESKCSLCGYNKNTAALEFHHLDPKKKDFSLSSMDFSWSIERLRSEIDKCILVCANCHREIHNPNSNIEPVAELEQV